MILTNQKRYQVLSLAIVNKIEYFIWTGRRLCWADLAFYNSDLYEGLRAMLNDAKWMTEEEFVEVYPCTFEVEVISTGCTHALSRLR